MSLTSTTTSSSSNTTGIATSQINKSHVTEASAIRHSVCRSKEFLSCAKTAWKIQQQRHDPATPPLPIPNLQLASTVEAPLSLTILEEGLTLLRAMDYGAQQLQKLVRRRGHTNDPTAEISKLVQQLEQDTSELTDFCQQLLTKYARRRKQERKHWEFVVQWFQQVAAKYSKQLQDCLKLRGEVLAEQAQQRRKLVDNTQKKKKKTLTTSAANRANATPLFDSPLFQPKKTGATPRTAPVGANGSTRNKPKPLNGARNGYGGSSNGYNYTSSSGGYGGGGYGGYGGGYRSSDSTGMRQRKGAATSSYPQQQQQQQQNYQEEEEQKVHYQIQQRQQQRQTQQRLDEARQAETALGELGQLFGKMSSLIVQQGETLEKIEDDVEAAHADVMAGQEEITKLYAIKKGNRPLIIKTFAILIFLIIFMKGYKN